MSVEFWRAVGKMAELDAEAWQPVLRSRALTVRLDRLAEHAAGVGITARMGDRKAAAHHLDAFLRELRILTDSAAEVSPALVVAFGSRAILARVLAVHAQMRMRERLGLEITSSDVLRMLDKFGPTGPRAPTRGTFAELYAALGKKRPANRPLGASKLGESRDEVEGHIRDALQKLLGYGPNTEKSTSREEIARTIGVGVRTLGRAIERFDIDLDALRHEMREARDAREKTLRGKKI